MSKQNFDNRLLLDESWQTPEFKIEFLRKFVPGDPIMFQITTNYDISQIKIYLCNQDNSIDQSALFLIDTIYVYSDSSNLIVYNITLDQSQVTYDGFKFIKIGSIDPAEPNTWFRSESFVFDPYYKFFPYISWQNSDRDGIFWDSAGRTIFGIRAALRLDYVPFLEASIFQGFRFQPETEYSVSKRGYQIYGDPMARYEAETLKLAFDHFNVWINDVEVNSNGATPKITKIEFTNEYNFEHVVLEVAYEDYSVLQEITGTVISTADYLCDNDNIVLADNDESILTG